MHSDLLYSFQQGNGSLPNDPFQIKMDHVYPLGGGMCHPMCHPYLWHWQCTWWSYHKSALLIKHCDWKLSIGKFFTLEYIPAFEKTGAYFSKPFSLMKSRNSLCFCQWMPAKPMMITRNNTPRISGHRLVCFAITVK